MFNPHQNGASPGGPRTEGCSGPRECRGQLHPPGFGGVPQDQAGHTAVGQGVPVDAILCALLQREAEVEVHVQHVGAVGVGQRATNEVGLHHVVAQRARPGRHLKGGGGGGETSDTNPPLDNV